MKNILKTTVAALILVACSMTIGAQDNNSQRMSREQLAEAQAKHIAKELGLDEGTTKKYVETYCDYQREIWALGPRKTDKTKTEMTDAEADREIQARFDRSEKILSIRQKYYKRYSQFLTPKQINHSYKLERAAMKRLAKHGEKGQRGKKDGGRRGRVRQSRK